MHIHTVDHKIHTALSILVSKSLCGSAEKELKYGENGLLFRTTPEKKEDSKPAIITKKE